MIQLHVSSQTLVFPLEEVLGAPDPDGAVIGAGCQVFPITAEIQACHIPAMALRSTRYKD